MVKIGDRVITPGGHTGTVLSILDDTSVEVELDFGGLMHYNVHSLKVILMPAQASGESTADYIWGINLKVECLFYTQEEEERYLYPLPISR